MMKKIIIACILCIAIICSCTADKNKNVSNRSTGSSIESNTTGSIATASGSMVCVTEAAVKTDKSKKIQTDNISTLRYANDKNIYLGDGDQKIYQYDLCGRRTKCYDLCIEMGGKKKDYYWTEVLWVDNDSIFFSCYREGNNCELWHVPLSKKKRPLMPQKERIAKVKQLDCLVTKTNEEIVYCADEKIYKVNLETKQKQVLNMGIGSHLSVWGIIKDRQGIPFIQNNKIYYKGNWSKMYQLDLEDWKSIYIGEKGGVRDFVEKEGSNLYFETQDEAPNHSYLLKWFARYDLQSGKKVKLFSREKLRKEIKKSEITWKSFAHKVNGEEGWGGFDIEQSYYCEGRLYVAVRITGEYNDWEAWLMFSCQALDGSGLRFEKEVTEYLWKNSIPYKDDVDGEEENTSCDPIIWDLKHVTGEFLYYLDGCIVMHFYDKKAKGDKDAHQRFVVYDIDTRTFRKIKKYSKEYGYFKALGFSETSELVR